MFWSSLPAKSVSTKIRTHPLHLYQFFVGIFEVEIFFESLHSYECLVLDLESHLKFIEEFRRLTLLLGSSK